MVITIVTYHSHVPGLWTAYKCVKSPIHTTNIHLYCQDIFLDTLSSRLHSSEGRIPREKAQSQKASYSRKIFCTKSDTISCCQQHLNTYIMSLNKRQERVDKINILDGGFSSQLSVHVGNKVDGDPLWTARFLSTNPKAVLATHLDFLQAGADIIQTNTYQASIGGFMKYLNLTRQESLELIKSAVNLAKEAVQIYSKEDKNCTKRIVGSVGPYGAALHDGSEYTGVYDDNASKDVIKDWHRPRLEALIKNGVDLLALETIPNKIEAEALVELLGDYPEAKAWISFSCREDGKSLADGSNINDTVTLCYEKALPGQIVAVGVNCIAPRLVAPLLKEINKNKGNNGWPLVVYPNSGEQYVVDKGWQGGEALDPFGNFIQDWLKLGVRYIGGCCRMYAKDITKIRNIVEEWEKTNTK